MQDAAIREVIELIERIDPAEQRDILLRSIREGDMRRQLHQRLEFFYAVDGYGLAALEPEIRPGQAAAISGATRPAASARRPGNGS